MLSLSDDDDEANTNPSTSKGKRKASNSFNINPKSHEKRTKVIGSFDEVIKSQDEGWSLVFSKNIQILMFVLFCFGCLGKRQIEAQKLDFEKEKWIHQLKVDENKI